MVTHFDEKGKIYTDIVQKQAVWVTIQLPHSRVHGAVFLRNNERIKEGLDEAGTFIALTQAEIYTSDGASVEQKTNLLVINKSQIIWVLPDAEIA
jgi:hypothetical protein